MKFDETNMLPVIDCSGMIDSHEIVVEACQAGVSSAR